MNKLASVKKLAPIAFVAMVLVLAAPAPGMARRAAAGHGFSGGPHGAFTGHGGFEARRSFDQHRGFVHHGRGRVFIGVGPAFSWWPAYPYVGNYPPDYAYSPPQAYWYYCPSAGAYYPYAQSCPEPWVPVPAY